MQVFINPTDANNRDITWHNSVALEGYVKRLSIVAVSANAIAVTVTVAWCTKCVGILWEVQQGFHLAGMHIGVSAMWHCCILHYCRCIRAW